MTTPETPPPDAVTVLCEIRDALRQIRDVLAYVAVPPPAPPPAVECVHPPERRADLTSMGEVMWKCKDCGFTYRA